MKRIIRFLVLINFYQVCHSQTVQGTILDNSNHIKIKRQQLTRTLLLKAHYHAARQVLERSGTFCFSTGNLGAEIYKYFDKAITYNTGCVGQRIFINPVVSYC